METDLIFPVPIWRKQLDIDSNTLNDIKDICINLKNKVPGRTLTNRGGYQSNDISSILYNKYPLNLIYDYINNAIKSLEQELHVDRNINLKISNMWLNINRKGDTNVAHNHARSTFSGIIYIASYKNNQGAVFENPHPAEQFYLNNITSASSPLASRYYMVSSQPGMMYIFPSWLFHYVPAYEGDDERITIAFNIQ